MRTIFHLIIFILATTIGLGAQSSNTIFILDGSGSMWGKLGDDTKIVIARNVLKDAVKTIDDDKLGLYIYGHRRKSDCSDIEMVFTPGLGSQMSFITSIDQINPTGKTPLARSAVQVIDYLKSTGEKANVILITDGIETCDGDLCTVIKEAKDGGIEFVLHIVGFGLGDEDRKPLECAAQAGGGMYMDADDEKGLSEAIEASKELKVEDIASRLSVQCMKDDKLVDALIEVYQSGTEEQVTQVRSYISLDTNPALIGVPYGKYDLKISVIGNPGIPDLWLKNILIDVDTIREERVDFTAGEVLISVLNNGLLHDATVNVFNASSGKRVEGGRSYKHEKTNPISFELSPGQYEAVIKSVTIEGLDIEKRMSFQVESRKIENLEYNYRSGTLTVGAKENGMLRDAIVRVVDSATNKAIDQARTYNHDKSNPKTFILQPGSYTIYAKAVKAPKEQSAKIEIVIEPGGSYSHTFNLK